MLATSARIVPDIASASGESLAGANMILPFSFFTVTRALTGRTSVPSEPLTLIVSAFVVTSTPLGTAIGIFPTRDMTCSFSTRSLSYDMPLRHVHQDFAADAGLPRLAIGHHALGRGDDGDAAAVHDARDVVPALVDPQARTADALDLLDHGMAGVVLQRDLELGLGTLALDPEAVDVALVLQDLGNRHLQLRRRHRDARLFHHLRVADAGQHIGDRITHAHGSNSCRLARAGALFGAALADYQLALT